MAGAEVSRTHAVMSKWLADKLVRDYCAKGWTARIYTGTGNRDYKVDAWQ